MTFDEFARKWLPAALRFTTALAGDPDLAKDLVQEVLIRASGRWQHIGALDRPEAYVRKMLVNEYLSWRRRSWRLIPSGMDDHVTGHAWPDPAEGYVERQALLAELAKLSRRRRTAVVLRYYEGCLTPRSPRSWAARRARSVATFPRRSRPCGWN